SSSSSSSSTLQQQQQPSVTRRQPPAQQQQQQQRPQRLSQQQQQQQQWWQLPTASRGHDAVSAHHSSSWRSSFHGASSGFASHSHGVRNSDDGCSPNGSWGVMVRGDPTAVRMGAVAGPEAATSRPALLVTIGPQCAGKTSLLRALAAKSEAAREE
ncbi:unnamed protein product, partial [Ectocarpus sp. 12 AP-2014]